MRDLRTLLLSAALLLCSSSTAADVASVETFERGWVAYDHHDFHTAFELWRPLAEQGHANAQINLGVMYDFGKGVEQDFARAADWYRAAALQGSAIAQYNLGIFLLEGKVDGNNNDALEWLRKAAAQDYVDAQYQLGLLYGENPGSQLHRSEAPRWLYRAALGYVSSGDTERARSAASALQRVAPGHRFVRTLQQYLENASSPVTRALATRAGSALSTGTAWPVAAGYAVTNHHVIAGKQSIALVDGRGNKLQATVVASDEIHDIALLRVDQVSQLPPALPLAGTAARLGARVFTIGFPRVDTMGTTPKLSFGIVSSVNGLRDDPTSYQISVPIQPGNSGGPLLNMQGEVVGLITSMLGTVDSANGTTHSLPGINYALKIDIVEGLLRDLPKQAHSINELSAAPENLEELANKVQRSVLIVMAE